MIARVPDVWLQLGAYIHQDFLLQFPDFLSGVGDFCSGQQVDQLIELLSFLDTLLASGSSDDELANAWAQSGAGFLVAPSDAKAFLTEIRDYLTQMRLDGA